MMPQSISGYIRNVATAAYTPSHATTSRADVVMPRPTHMLPATVNETLPAAAANSRTCQKSISRLMKKRNQFAAITARRRRRNSPERHYEKKHDSIRAYCWTIKYAKRDMPQLTFTILLHRAATTACTTAVATALESACEDIANTTVVVVTFCRKAFLRIAHGHLHP